MQAYSLSGLRRERDELIKDRAAFAGAYDKLTRRIIDSLETDIDRKPKLHEWSGTRAVVGSLEMSIHAIERTIDEMSAIIHGIESGQIPNLDPPTHLHGHVPEDGDKN